MFSKNLKYYRLKKQISKAELASMVGISPMSITHYENGDRRPDMSVIKLLAKALDVKTADFISSRNTNLVFVHGEFRKNSNMAKARQEYIRESVEEYFNRFYEVLEYLGGETLEKSVELGCIKLSGDVEKDGMNLRKHLGFSSSGPISRLVEQLENKGILIYMLEDENRDFNGINGTINGRPYIAVNRNMTSERIRTTIVHELAHLMFDWNSMKIEDNEKYSTAIAGSFLFPREDVFRELGISRKAITTDMYMVCKEYGIAMSLLVVRAHLCKVISDTVYTKYFRQNGKNENSRIEKEESTLFEQLVYRAVNEEEITIQKGAELLKTTYENVEKYCCYAGNDGWTS